GGSAPARRSVMDEASGEMHGDAANPVLHIPVALQSGANRVRFLAHLQPPQQSGDPWTLVVNNGSVMLGSAERTRDPPLVFDRIALQARIDTAKRRIAVKQGELMGIAGGASLSAQIAFPEAETRLSRGVIGTRMPMLPLKRLWPAFVVPPLRAWVIDHFPSGTVDHLEIATNAPWNTLKPGGPPVPETGMSGEISGTVSLKPIDTLPAIRDANMVAKFTGRTATVTLGRGTGDLPTGREIPGAHGISWV